MSTEEVILSLFGMKCSLVGGKVKVLDTFSKPFSLLEQNIELEADHEYTRLWEERLQCHIDTMRNDLPVLYEEWLDNLSTNKGDVANATNTNMSPTIKIKDEYSIVSKVGASTNLLHTINRNTLHISEAYTSTLVEIETDGVKLKHYNYNNVINYDENTTTMVFWNESEGAVLLKVEVGIAGLVNVDCMFGKVIIEITFLPAHVLKTIEYETLELGE